MGLGYEKQWKEGTHMERTAGWQSVRWSGMQKYFQWATDLLEQNVASVTHNPPGEQDFW